MKRHYISLIAAMLLSFAVTAQSNESAGPTFIGTMDYVRTAPSLDSRSNLIPAEPRTGKVNDGRSSKNAVVPGKGAIEEDDFYYRYKHQMSGVLPGRTPSLVFDVNNNVGPPSDPALAVGPDHVFIVYNTGFNIYDKDGADLTGPLNVNNIFSAGGCCDLTASYDNVADRWVITYLFVGAGMEVAISDGPDPITADWFVYTVPQIDDYNKLSVWSDGYYLTQNSGGNDKVWALDRTAMLAGDAAPSIQGFAPPGMVTSGFSSCQVLNITDDTQPAAGNATVIYMQDDAWAGVASDHIKVWDLDVDFATPGNSVISPADEITVTPFVSVFDGGSFVNLTQPGGGDIDALQATIMNQAQYRKFPTHNSAVFNFVVDVEAGAGELAAVRWYELRQDADGDPWTVYQEGTYTAPDGRHAWHASLAMDYLGNIGMGYTSMAGPTTANPTDFRVSSYYTGRYASDPVGVMTVSEELISAGTGDIGGTRYGDYSKIDVDPVNDKEFWFINEYIQGGGADVVGVFQIASDLAQDIGVVSVDTPESGLLTAAETVTVTVFNFGLEAATGFNVEYSIDGGAVISEPYVGSLASGTGAQFTFTTTADLSTEGQTYSIFSQTVSTVDEFSGNDGLTVERTHLSANDVGVTSIASPTSSADLGAAEAVTVVIENFGYATQTSIPVYFTVDGGAPVSETYTGSLEQGASVSYTFTGTVDMLDLGDYNFVAGTELDGDSNEDNDDAESVVTKFICQPESNCTGFGDGVTMIQLADQDIITNCNESGYSDDTDIVFNFMLDQNPFDGVLQVGWADSNYAIWIDFNDNFTFEDDELVAGMGDLVADQDVDHAFNIDFSTIPTTTTGMHLMRLRGEDESGDGDGFDPCDDLQFGRTNDYTANISGVIGVGENAFVDADVVIATLADDQYRLTLNTTDFTDQLPVTIYNVTGETLAYYTLTSNGSGYTKTIDMSYVASGVYFVRVGNEQLNVVKRIVVE